MYYYLPFLQAGKFKHPIVEQLLRNTPISQVAKTSSPLNEYYVIKDYFLATHKTHVKSQALILQYKLMIIRTPFLITALNFCHLSCLV